MAVPTASFTISGPVAVARSGGPDVGRPTPTVRPAVTETAVRPAAITPELAENGRILLGGLMRLDPGELLLPDIAVLP
jgi:hypothetical protein